MKAARRVATLAVPVAINLAMPVVYRRLARQLGPQRGYLAGFAVYWSLCLAIPAAILGPRRAASLLTDARSPGRSRSSGWRSRPSAGSRRRRSRPSARACA